MVSHNQHLRVMPFDRLAQDVPRVPFHHFKDSMAHLQPKIVMTDSSNRNIYRNDPAAKILVQKSETE